MTKCWGAELAPDGETAAGAAVFLSGDRYLVELVFYGPAASLAAALGDRYDAEPDSLGVFVDPMPCAGILDALAQRMWVHKLEAVDVAAAAQQFREAVRSGIAKAAGPHPALEQALTYAVQRPLATAFGFERRKVLADMSPLNASAFGFWGLRRNEEASTPGAWAL